MYVSDHLEYDKTTLLTFLSKLLCNSIFGNSILKYFNLFITLTKLITSITPHCYVHYILYVLLLYKSFKYAQKWSALDINGSYFLKISYISNSYSRKIVW